MESLYIEYRGDKPIYYAFGEPWVAVALFNGDIRFKTEKEAREAWERRNKNGRWA